MSNNNFYLSDNIPEVFKCADRIMAEKYPQPVKAKRKKVVPMPDINSNPNIEGPLCVTQEWYDKKSAKKEKKRRKEQREYEIEMIQLVARRDLLRKKLGELNPGKKKDSKRIAAINIELTNIRDDLKMLETQSGLHIDEIDKGTKLGRFIGKIKMKVKKAAKKVKKFCKRNSELILGICSIVLPIIASKLFKIFSKD